MVQAVNLDTVVASLSYFVPKWTPALRRNASPYLLRLVVCKLYGASKGNLFHAKIQASQDSLAASLDISREWANQILARRDTGEKVGVGRAEFVSTIGQRLTDTRDLLQRHDGSHVQLHARARQR